MQTPPDRTSLTRLASDAAMQTAGATVKAELTQFAALIAPACS